MAYVTPRDGETPESLVNRFRASVAGSWFFSWWRGTGWWLETIRMVVFKDPRRGF